MRNTALPTKQCNQSDKAKMVMVDELQACFVERTSELSRRFPTLVLPFEILLPPAKCPEAGKRSDLLSNIGNLLFEV